MHVQVHTPSKKLDAERLALEQTPTTMQTHPDINLEFLQSLQQPCSRSGSNTTLADLDHMTASTYDNTTPTFCRARVY